MVFYRLGGSLELLGGVRYNRIHLRLSTSLQVTDGLSREEDWIDPIFGVRFLLHGLQRRQWIRTLRL